MPGGPSTSPAPLTVAVDATSLLGRPTGIGVFTAGLLAGLAGRSDVEPSAFAVSWRRREGIEALLPRGVPARQRAMPARPLHLAWRHCELPPVEWFIGPTDVVHGPNFVVPPTRKAARVMSVQDLTPVRFPELCDPATLVFPSLVARALDHGAFVHASTRFVADEVLEYFRCPPERVVVVNLGLPSLPEATSTAEVTDRFPEGVGRYVLAVGTAEPRKDLPGLVRAFDDVAAKEADVALVRAGQRGWGADALDRAIAASPHASRIVLTGWIDDGLLAGLYGGASVLAFPSLYEGFGYPPLQAMAAGVPVVSTATSSLPEVLGDAALLVPVGDPDALAEALLQALGDEALRATLVARGHERAAHFGWDRCTDEMVGLYRTALEAA